MLKYLLFLGLFCLSSTEALARQKRAWIIDSFQIVEEYPGPFPYDLGQITLDRANLVEFMLKGKGVDEEPKGVLSIDSNTGVIKVHRKVDFEEYKVLMLTFQARNRSNQAIDTQLGVEVNIQDINDNPPVFQRRVYEVTINEATKQGSFVVGVQATDKDEPGTLNSTIDYKFISVTPVTKNTEFYIQDGGTISFKGCLEYEVANRYTLVVEAKDRGEVVKLSSTATVIINIRDGNNHPPVITGQAGSGKVLEMTTGSSPLSVHTSDADTRYTAAWRVRYSIEGDKDDHFTIHTDPKTNDGIITVVKALDFERKAEQNIVISVENEEPYFFCEVKQRPSDGLWTVITDKGTTPLKPSSRNFTIAVEDVNDPPYFPEATKKIIMEENGVIGALVHKVTAVDPDTGRPNGLEYSIGQDPAGWVRVDKTTGEIFVKENLDRESIHVINGTYTITVIVTEKDDPTMSSTATVQIFIEDKNDNVPVLKENIISVCQSDGDSSTNITAYDLDGNPYSGPFSFEVLEDTKKQWSFDPSHGETVRLVKKSNVHAGLFTLLMKISDKQGKFIFQNLSVAVCDCVVSPNCLQQRNSQHKAGGGLFGIVLFALLLFLACLMLSLTCSCGAVKSLMQVNHVLEDALLPSNTENPGTDCTVPTALLKKRSDSQTKEVINVNNTLQKKTDIQQVSGINTNRHSLSGQMDEYWSRDRSQYYSNETWMRKQSLFRRDSHYQGTTLSRRSSQRQDNYVISQSALHTLLYVRLNSIQALENEQLNYEPKVYVSEDDPEHFVDLDPIDMPNNEFDPNVLSDLGPAFKHLAAVCIPKTR